MYFIVPYSEHYIHGKIEGSKPNTIYPYTYKEPFNLRVNDIVGCEVGSKNRISKYSSQYDYNLNIKDIKGANAGSLKKGIITERHTNPIDPKYNFIGERELGKYFINDPYADMKKNELEVINEMPNMEVERKSNKDNIYKENEKKVKFEEVKSIENENNIDINDNLNQKYFNSELFTKPEPNYSYIHDKAIISSIDPLRKREFKEKKNSNISFNQAAIENSRKDSFFEKKTNAQKLDSFIHNKI